jgi:hypothetical protein
MSTEASDRVKRLAFKLDVHTLKELALALGIETVQSTRRKLTKDDLAKAIWRRADYMRERVNLAKFEQDELRSEVSALKEQVWELQVSSMIDNDGPDDSDGETLYHCDIAVALEAAGEAGTPAAPTWTRGASTTYFGITSDELVSLTVKTMWQDFAELELHPRDEVRELQVNVRELFGFESYSDVVLHADGKQMHPLRRIEDYFAVGTSGTILVGCMLEGGGRAEKRNRSDTSSLGGGVGSGSVLTLDAFDSEGEDESMEDCSKIAALRMEFAKIVASVKGQPCFTSIPRIVQLVQECESMMAKDDLQILQDVLKQMPLDVCKAMMRDKALGNNKNPKWLCNLLSQNYLHRNQKAELRAMQETVTGVSRLYSLVVYVGYLAKYTTSSGRINHGGLSADLPQILESKIVESKLKEPRTNCM